MKWKNTNKMVIAALALLVAGPFSVIAQDSTKKELVVNLGYFMNNNKITWLMVNAKTKIDKKFQPVKEVTINLYLDKDSAANLVGKVITNENGVAKAIIPPALKAVWERSATHTFIGITEANKEFDETKAEATITKTKITIDTLAGAETRTIKVSVSAFNGNEWSPAKDVEMKVGVSRSAGSILSAGDEATYTTDSTGTVTAEFKKVLLPGDEKGNIVLVAKVEDNDKYGNLVVEKSVPWGVAEKTDNSFFDQRTLWSTRFRTPFWLLFMAYSIVIGVWGTIIYLIIQIVKIKKIGMSVKS
jgi:hypothetical protein